MFFMGCFLPPLFAVTFVIKLSWVSMYAPLMGFQRRAEMNLPRARRALASRRPSTAVWKVKYRGESVYVCEVRVRIEGVVFSVN